MGPHDRDDDLDEEPVAAPDAPETAGERTRAESFAHHVEALMAGERPPPVLAPQERALLQTATAIRAGHGAIQLSAERSRALVEAALAAASALGAAVSGDEEPTAAPRTSTPAAPAAPAAGAVVSLPDRRARARRALPWVAAAIAAAAALVLALRPPASGPRAARAPTAEAVPARLRSRPADPLVGAIARADSGRARERIDVLYADRLSAYRERRLGGSP